MKEGFPEAIPSSESTHDFSEIMNIVSRIEELALSNEYSQSEIIEWSRELVADLLEHIERDFELQLTQDVTSIYKNMNRENLLARVESVKKVIECLANETPIEVGKGGEKYANSVTSDLEGLRIAMAEAEALGPVRLLVGLDLKALVGFTNDHVEVTEISEQEFDLRDTTLRQAYCRHLEGEIRKEDIRHMVMRIPRKVFPVQFLNDIEKKQNTPFIFRGVTVGQPAEATEYESQVA